MRRYRSEGLVGVLAFLALFAVVVGFAATEARRHAAERAAAQENELSQVGSVLTKDLDVALGELRSFAFWVGSDPALASSRFDEYSRQLLKRYPTLLRTALLKDDVISQAYPPDPDLIGLDVGRHPVLGKAVQELRRKREGLVTGPVVLRRGGHGLILRAPVYDNQDGRAGRYWGHVSLVFDIARMEQILKRSEQAFRTHLHLADADGTGPTAEFELGSSNGGPATQRLEIVVPAERWTISVSSTPMNADPGISWLFVAGGLVVSLAGGFAVVLLMITSRRLHDQNDELQKLAITDPLTGAFNRRAVVERTEAELVLTQRTGKAFCVLLLDLDHFKEINDHHGHAAGDSALKAVVAIVRKELRQTDVVGRWGGEEFLLIAVQTPEQGALELAERLRSRLAETPIRAGYTHLRISASFGVAESCATDTAEALIDRADQGLYQAKAKGRNRCESVPVPPSSYLNVIPEPLRRAKGSGQG